MEREERKEYIGSIYHIIREFKDTVDNGLGYYPDEKVKQLERIFQETRNRILLECESKE